MLVQVIISSVRPSRIGDQVAHWVIEAASSVNGLTFELVDLKDWYLPMDDEPEQPKHGGYTQPHTRAFSKKIASAAGFIFVTPQYNWGYPASLKNALDHLYYEWADKPAAIVTYGARGGVKCAAQLREVLKGLHMVPVDTMPALIFKPEMLGPDRRLPDPAPLFQPQLGDMHAATRELATALASRRVLSEARH